MSDHSPRIRRALKSAFHYFASIRFAIPLMLAFAASLIVGTVLESKYGTQYAGRMVYFTWWFFALLGGIVISVTFSLYERLPIKPRLIGFYVVHVSIVIVVIGAVITRMTGLDGTIELAPGKPANTVLFGDDYLYVNNGATELKLKLPFTASNTEINKDVGAFGDYQIRVLDYLPYAEERQVWEKGGSAWVSRWMVKNANFAEKVEIADRPLLDLLPTAQMGPLTVKVVAGSLLAELKEASKSKGRKPFILFDRITEKAYSITKFPAEIQVAKGTKVKVEEKSLHGGNMTAYAVHTPEEEFRYFPKFSSFPVARDLSEQKEAPFEFFDPELMAETPTVMMSRGADGKIQLGYGKGPQWTFTEYGDKPITLPWMGIELTLMGEQYGEKPRILYVPAVANKDDGKNTRAALIEIKGPGIVEQGWLSNRREFNFAHGGLMLAGWINPQTQNLPWKFILEDFKMDKIPGTEDPASYESFVRIGAGGDVAHIFMNHPFKKDGYTFYQSSYFQDDMGRYHTILSVNKDPGRPVKYAGSLLLVFGMILHFLILHGHVNFAKKRAAPPVRDGIQIGPVAVGGEG